MVCSAVARLVAVCESICSRTPKDPTEKPFRAEEVFNRLFAAPEERKLSGISEGLVSIAIISVSERDEPVCISKSLAEK